MLLVLLHSIIPCSIIISDFWTHFYYFFTFWSYTRSCLLYREQFYLKMNMGYPNVSFSYLQQTFVFVLFNERCCTIPNLQKKQTLQLHKALCLFCDPSCWTLTSRLLCNVHFHLIWLKGGDKYFSFHFEIIIFSCSWTNQKSYSELCT